MTRPTVPETLKEHLPVTTIDTVPARLVEPPQQPSPLPAGRSSFWLSDYTDGELMPDHGEIPPQWARTNWVGPPLAPMVLAGSRHKCPDPDCAVSWSGDPVCWACGTTIPEETPCP